MYAIVSTKGQVTIPVNIRRNLGIKPGSYVKFTVREKKKRKEIVIQPINKNKKNLFDQLFGSLNKDGKIKYIPLNKARQILADKLKEEYNVSKNRSS